jgi:hypothetical protein
MADMASSMREGLLALAVGAGMQVMARRGCPASMIT